MKTAPLQLDGENLKVEALYNFCSQADRPQFVADITFTKGALKKIKDAENFVGEVVKKKKAV